MKNMTKFAVAAFAALSAGTLFAGGTEGYGPSTVDARMNFTIKPTTEEVVFVRDNNDPSVYTKTYVLKHADPYEVRAILWNIVRARRVGESNDTGVQAVKYNDGTGIVMISAEDYRFDDAEGVMGFDTIMKMLDVPKITNASGSAFYVYNPVYRSAAELQNMVASVGAAAKEEISGSENVLDDALLLDGCDQFVTDPGLNLIFFKTARFSKPTIEKMLKLYDAPYSEVNVKVTVYELYAENDEKLGFDFQAWKNNDGINLLSAGARGVNHFGPDKSLTLATRQAGWSDIQYFQFNPKWNTKYIDFLTSKGKGKVLTTSMLTVRGGTTAEISRETQIFTPVTEKIEDETYSAAAGMEVVGIPEEMYYDITTRDGEKIRINANNPTGQVKINVTRVSNVADTDAKYTLRIKGGFFSYRVKGSLKVVKTPKVTAAECYFEGHDFTASPDLTVSKGNKVNTTASVPGTFGFRMAVTPGVCGEATNLNVKIENRSLIGYNADGTPRIQRGAAIDTQFMISNKGTKLVIGGIEKKDVVSISGGIPILKDLPILGWIFSTESESTKKSQLVVVAEVVPSKAGVTGDAKKTVDDVNSKVKDAGGWNKVGYRQFLLDPDRLK